MKDIEHESGSPDDRSEPILREEVVKIEEVIKDGEVVIVEEIIDIEVYAKAKKKPPHARGYKLRIDKVHYTVHVPMMTGREILALAGKTPETYLLSQKIHGGQVVPIAADETVDFREPGIERFQTLALDPTEGSGDAS